MADDGVGLIHLRHVVESLSPQCADGGCQLRQARQILIEAQRLMGRNSQGEIVSQALWCDQGEHAFSARDPKSEHWERQGTDPKTGEKVSVPWDVCGKHMEAINARFAALESSVDQESGRPDRHEPDRA